MKYVNEKISFEDYKILRAKSLSKIYSKAERFIHRGNFSQVIILPLQKNLINY